MKKNIIFVDYFNTVVLRKHSAEDVVFLWAKKLSEKYKSISSEKFYSLYLACSKFLFKKALELHGEYEFAIEELLQEMQNRIKIYALADIDDDFCTYALKTYIQTEKENQIINKKVVNFLYNQKQLGKKIYIVSDFYCNKNILQFWLENLKIDSLFENIFVSCDYYLSKKTGALYKLAIETLNIDAKVQMFGDNKLADYLMPKKLGIAAKHLKIYNPKNKLVCSPKIGLNIPQNYNKIFKLYGGKYNFSNYAFPLFLFTQRLADKVKELNIKDLYFLSREGKFLKKLFDEYKTKNNIKVQTHYLLVSRKSILTASLKPIEEETFAEIIKEVGTINLTNVLLTIGFSEEEIEIIKNQTQLDFEIELPNFVCSAQFNILKQNKTFLAVYNQHRHAQNKLFKLYMDENTVKSDNIYLVDVGWRGTMQDLIFKFCSGKVNCVGFYLGYLCSADICLNNLKYGLLYSDCPYYPDSDMQIFYYNIFWHEEILRADHGSIIGYNLDQNSQKVAPILEYKQDEINCLNSILKLQEQIFYKFKLILNEENNKNFPLIARNCFIKMIKRSSLADLLWMINSENSHYDNFARNKYTMRTSKIKKLIIYYLKKLKYMVKYSKFYKTH